MDHTFITYIFLGCILAPLQISFAVAIYGIYIKDDEILEYGLKIISFSIFNPIMFMISMNLTLMFYTYINVTRGNRNPLFPTVSILCKLVSLLSFCKYCILAVVEKRGYVNMVEIIPIFYLLGYCTFYLCKWFKIQKAVENINIFV